MSQLFFPVQIAHESLRSTVKLIIIHIFRSMVDPLTGQIFMVAVQKADENSLNTV